MLRALMEIIENMYEQIENVCRQVEILRKNLKDMQEIKKKTLIKTWRMPLMYSLVDGKNQESLWAWEYGKRNF